jgi:hypothetical protein
MQNLRLHGCEQILGIGLMVTFAFVATSFPAVAQKRPATDQCRIAGPLARVAELPEASGLALSRRSPERLWSHNDSGGPSLVALNTRGAVTGRVRLSGVRIDDWEAVAVGACPGGSCVYIGDIGDNDAKRPRITVHRLVEPATTDTASVTESFHATYPDGAHDAETLLVAPDGRLYIVTKGETASIALYRFPGELQPGASHQLERVGAPANRGKDRAAERITDGTVSTDGTWVALRTRTHLLFYRSTDFFAGRWVEAGRVPLKAAGEPQGEGVAMASDGSVYLAGEGGGKSQAGTFTRLACTLKMPLPS